MPAQTNPAASPQSRSPRCIRIATPRRHLNRVHLAAPEMASPVIMEPGGEAVFYKQARDLCGGYFLISGSLLFGSDAAVFGAWKSP